MEVFKIFASLSLMDAISTPLANIRSGIERTGNSAQNLSQKITNLAGSLKKVALAGSAFLVVLGGLSSEAIAFESKMADVAKVVEFESQSAFNNMSEAILDLSLNIPIAAEGIADIVAAAAQCGIAQKDLLSFTTQAGKMGVAFEIAAGEASKTMANWRAAMGLTLDETYALADAINHLSSNFNATAPDLAEVMNRIGAVGKAAGFTQQELAALGAAALSSGAGTEVVGTGLNSVFATLTAGQAITGRAASSLKKLGFESSDLAKRMQEDAKSSILEVFTALKNMPQELQLSMINDIFGQGSLKTIAPLVGNLDNLKNAFATVADSASYASSMENEFQTRTATTENSIILFKNSLNVLAITIGSLFTPYIDKAAKAFKTLSSILIDITRSKIGATILKVAAAFSALVVGVTAALTVFIMLKPVLFAVVLAVKSVFWPVLLITAAAFLLYKAWKNNWGGIASTVSENFEKISLVIQGVISVFKSLSGSQGYIKGELAEKIEAKGLMGLTTSISKTIFRFYNFFKGIFEGIKEQALEIKTILEPAFSSITEAVKPLWEYLGFLAEKLFGAAAGAESTAWNNLGKIIGGFLMQGFKVLSQIIAVVARILGGFLKAVISASGGIKNKLKPLLDKLSTIFNKIYQAVKPLINIFLDWAKSLFKASDSANIDIWETLSEVLGSVVAAALDAVITLIDVCIGAFISLGEGIGQTIAALVTFGENIVSSIMGGIETAINFIQNINLAECGQKLIDTLVEGIKSAANGLLSTVENLFTKVREFLPFSDAKRGPFSSLTRSGAAFIETLIEGIKNKAGFMLETVKDLFTKVREFLPFSDAKRGPFANLTRSGAAFPETFAQGMNNSAPILIENTNRLFNRLNMNKQPIFSGVDKKGLNNNTLVYGAEQKNQKFKERPIVVNIARLELSEVKNGSDFVNELQNIVLSYNG